VLPGLVVYGTASGAAVELENGRVALVGCLWRRVTGAAGAAVELQNGRVALVGCLWRRVTGAAGAAEELENGLCWRSMLNIKSRKGKKYKRGRFQGWVTSGAWEADRRGALKPGRKEPCAPNLDRELLSSGLSAGPAGMELRYRADQSLVLRTWIASSKRASLLWPFGRACRQAKSGGNPLVLVGQEWG